MREAVLPGLDAVLGPDNWNGAAGGCIYEVLGLLRRLDSPLLGNTYSSWPGVPFRKPRCIASGSDQQEKRL
jgi:hypothetical protein